MKYLFLSAHTDDAELSCGGTMVKLIEQGHQVHNLAFSDCGSLELMDAFVEASGILGVSGAECLFYKRDFDEQKIADELYEVRTNFDFVFTHSSDCKHSHHRIIAEQSKRVINCNLFTYMQPWNGNENPNYFVEISEQQLEKKISALACYKSQAHRNYMSPDFIRSQAIYNGVKCGKRYAEAFRIEKLIN